MIFKLQKHLDAWVQAKIISDDQAQKILESETGKSNQTWFGYSLAAVGIVVMITGIVSMIAANWSEIGFYAKISAYFTLQIALGVGVLWSDARGKIWTYEGCLFAFALLFFGGIGLATQLFHLQGTGWKALCFWMGLTIGSVLISRKSILSHIWIWVSFVAATLWFFSSGVSDEETFISRAFVVASWPILLVAFSFLKEAFFKKEPEASWVGVARFWGLFIHLLSANIAGISIFIKPTIMYMNCLPFLLVPWLVTIICIAFNYQRRNVSKREQHAYTAMIVALGIFVTCAALMTPISSLNGEVRQFVGASAFIALWSVLATVSAIMGRKFYFDLCSFVIAMRFIVVYFEVFGSLTTTGLGLLVSGAVILGVSFVWYRFRGDLARRFEKGVRS